MSYETVALTQGEMVTASMVGVIRNAESLSNNRKRRFTKGPTSWEAHVLGALGEAVAAKSLGVYWVGGVCTFKNEGDVGRLEVRTRSRHDYELIIRDDDPDDRPYILVTGEGPEFRVHGWIMGKDARRDEWRQDHGGYEPAYFVPQAALRGLWELKVKHWN